MGLGVDSTGGHIMVSRTVWLCSEEEPEQIGPRGCTFLVHIPVIYVPAHVLDLQTRKTP